MHEGLQPVPAAALERPSESMLRYMERSVAANTQRAYASDLADFRSWCEAVGRPYLPTSSTTLAEYITHLAGLGRKVSTIARHISSVNQMNLAHGVEPLPTIGWDFQRTWRGIRRSHGARPPDQKAPLTAEDMLRIIDLTPADSLLGIRDRALLLFGFFAAVRRSNLVAFDVEDITEAAAGLRVLIRRSKTDQDGEGELVALKRRGDRLCPVTAYRAWLDASGIRTGPVWRPVNKRSGKLGRERLRDEVVADVVQDACRRAGLDPARYAGHSLRAGLATAAANGKAPSWVIQKQTKHRSEAMLRRYIREGELFADNAGDYVSPKES